MVMASKCAGIIISRNKSLKLYLNRTLCINSRFSPCIITVNHFHWPTKCTWLYKT